jgi:X-X-X-Leu-X-X-Gly heptad repeat protein
MKPVTAAHASSTSVQFTAHSPGTDARSRSGDRKVNASSAAKSTAVASRRDPDSSDRAQAQVFAAMLTSEIETVSALVDGAEQLARKAGRVGDGTARLWHEEQARSQRKLLYELHRQLDALTRRFPS